MKKKTYSSKQLFCSWVLLVVVKKVRNTIVWILLMPLGIVLGAATFYNESKPEGVEGAKADSLLLVMEKAINKPAWDSLQFLEWEFIGGNQYLWDRKRKLVRYKKGGKTVFFHQNGGESLYLKNGEVQEDLGEVEKAKENFTNDAFWLCAFDQIRDRGAKIEYVKTKKEEGLLVTYPSGGVTPGDSFLWVLDENGRPDYWKMWVKIIPVGGVKVKWRDWKELEGGVMVAESHKTGLFNVKTKNVKTYSSLTAFKKDPFLALVENER